VTTEVRDNVTKAFKRELKTHLFGWQWTSFSMILWLWHRSSNVNVTS